VTAKKKAACGLSLSVRLVAEFRDSGRGGRCSVFGVRPALICLGMITRADSGGRLQARDDTGHDAATATATTRPGTAVSSSAASVNFGR